MSVYADFDWNEYITENCASDKLYCAVRENDTAKIERLKAEGVTLSEYMKKVLTTGGGSIGNSNEYGMDWYDYAYGVGGYSAEDFVSVIRNLRELVGEPLYCSGTIIGAIGNIFFEPEVFRCVLECYANNTIKNKKWRLQEMVDGGRVDLLEIAGEFGWLKQKKQYDELLKYAEGKNNTECVAWLIDYRNRTVDLAAEREKEEKKIQRELNAAPDSVISLKQIWKYKKREDGTIIITGYKGTRTDIIVPGKIGKSEVTAIGTYAFSSNAENLTPEQKKVRESIEKITLPNTITEICYGAFCNCWSLVSINIPASVTEIHDYAFGYCGKLEEIILPAGQSMPSSLNRIGDMTFFNCESLKSINIPNNVTEICGYTFDGCKSLETVIIPESVTKIGGAAFSRCSSLKSMDIPPSITEIGNSAFNGCTALETVKIPDSVTKIGGAAFSACSSLKSIDIPSGVTEISADMFSCCASLVTVNIPCSVVKIREDAFNSCDSLVSVTIPEGVVEIGRTAFANCSALETIELPASVKSIKNRKDKGEEKSLSAFYMSDKVKASVVPKSYAEGYCRRNKIPYTYTEN